MNQPQQPQQPKQAPMPDGTWAISAEDKPIIRKFGRALNGFIKDYGIKEGALHARIVAGGFQYAMEIVSQRAKLIGEDLVLSTKIMEEQKLGDKIVEPFEDEPEPTPAEKASVAPGASKAVPGPADPIGKAIDEAEATGASAVEPAIQADGESAPVAPVASVAPEAPAPEVPAAPVTPEAPLPPTA